MSQAIRLILHGGAGAAADDMRTGAHLSGLGAQCAAMLEGGAAALDVVEHAVAEMEASGLYVAGRGSKANRDGDFEMDASIMDGATRRAGAVACVRRVFSPVGLARRVMQDTPHVLLAGAGADRFACDLGLRTIGSPAEYFVALQSVDEGGSPHGTVGAVALDLSGALAAATSTGGTSGKLAGRIGDSALIGAGTWADEAVAVSCTGLGEYFIRVAAAHEVAARVRLAHVPLGQAVDQVLAVIAADGGAGGIIAVSSRGEAVARWNTPAMKHYIAEMANGCM
ncbi:isoaspartyl peptidase/L-asparaginase [Aromatoleum toluclasticum]|uniref:isoaspartyl peptidase/L-asparaginase family protein n=1 Tax=Aromatoleum toluclasticum TaxID=92003 RepID=UPI001D181C0B|nr:isoaspartyl peptidase/L-asparaginase [Aromatoleum toluclasticum]MCC4115619.1 isoaspartyl peptidase/L-asparaginase [Aromatoleum toluclasticum]